MRFLPVFIRLEIQRQLCLLRRYPLQAISSLMGLILLGGVAWFGLRAAFFAEQGFQAVSGVLLWPFVMAALGFASVSLQEDMALGTIEQIYLALPSSSLLVHCRALVYLLFSAIATLPLWLLGLYYLGVDALFGWFVQRAAPLLLTVYGLGLAVGGVTLLYRRIGDSVNLLALGMISLTVIPLSGSGHRFLDILYGFLPLLNVSQMVEHEGWGMILLRYLAGLAYLLAGQWIFRKAEIKAKRLGLIGHY